MLVEYLSGSARVMINFHWHVVFDFCACEKCQIWSTILKLNCPWGQPKNGSLLRSVILSDYDWGRHVSFRKFQTFLAEFRLGISRIVVDRKGIHLKEPANHMGLCVASSLLFIEMLISNCKGLSRDTRTILSLQNSSTDAVIVVSLGTPHHS